MQRNDNSRPGPDVEIEYTSKPLSGWGGLLLVGRFFKRLGIRRLLERCLPDGRTSSNQVPVVDIALQLMLTVLTGGSRFAHAGRVGHDPMMKTIVGARRFGDPMTITRYFGGFRRGDSELLQQYVREMTGLLLGERSDDVLDLDSTVFSRYGEQEGVVRGYNPSRRGRQCHQALLGMLAESKLILHNWLRQGNASSCRGVNEFFREIVDALPKGFSIRAVRADSGFCSAEFFETLDEYATPCAISLRLTPPIKRWASTLTGWIAVEGGTDEEIAEGMFHPPYWKKARRVLVKRKRIRTANETTLFELPCWEYYAVMTTLSMSTADAWRFYNGRGDCENRIKELKYDFNADGFCLRSFYGTEAAFRLNCLLFNLITAFKTTVLRDTSITLATIRNRVFVVGAVLGSSGRKRIVRLGLTGRWQNDFKHLLDQLSRCVLSTVAQLMATLEAAALIRPSPWRARRSILPAWP